MLPGRGELPSQICSECVWSSYLGALSDGGLWGWGGDLPARRSPWLNVQGEVWKSLCLVTERVYQVNMAFTGSV